MAKPKKAKIKRVATKKSHRKKKIIKVKKPKRVLARKIKIAKKKVFKKLKNKVKNKLKSIRLTNIQASKNTRRHNLQKKKKIFKAVRKQVKIKKPKRITKKAKKIIKAIGAKPKNKIIKKIITPQQKTVLPKIELADSRDESLFKAKIRVIGIGGGGGSIVSEIGRSLEKASFIIADTDIRALKKKSAIKYFWFGENLTRGLGTGANPELAKKAAENEKEKLGSIFKDQDIVIFIASLGGGLGSGATQVFAEVARDFGGITFGIFTLPFKFEGKNKNRIAQNALKTLRPLLNVSLAIPNEKIFKIINADTPITEAFSIINKSLTGSLESLIDLIYNPGVINIDFADLRTILKGRGNLAFLNTIEESGKDRGDKICQRILSNPLLQREKLKSEKILFNVAGSDNLSMFEVEKISRHISDSNPDAKIIFGISKNQKLKNKIKTTILMTGEGTTDKIANYQEETIKETKEISHQDITEKAKTSDYKKKIKIIEKKHKKIQNKRSMKKEPHDDSDAGKNNKKLPALKPPKKEEEVLIPVFGKVAYPADLSPVSEKRLSVVEASQESYKNLPASRHGAIRRSGLEVKKAQEQEEKKRMAQEKEWEIPAFLRRVKFNK
jgi:cell division protein FtsZ